MSYIAACGEWFCDEGARRDHEMTCRSCAQIIVDEDEDYCDDDDRTDPFEDE